MKAIDLIHTQLALECVGFDGRGRLTRIPGPDPDAIARLFVSRHTDGYLTYFRHDVDDALVAAISALPEALRFGDTTTVLALLYPDAAERPQGPAWRGAAYVFERVPEPQEFEGVVEEQAQTFVLLEGGEPVARAWSSRSNAVAAELAVETAEPFRRRGYAQKVACAWAHHQLTSGRIAFYSHLAHNDRSRALARRLGVVHFMDAVGYA